LVEVFIGLILRTTKKSPRIHHLNDSFSSLTAGSLEFVWSTLIPSIFTKSIAVVSYVYVYESFHLIEVDENSLLAWVVCFLGVDLGYYWFHRMAHELNAFWGAHVVHHSSGEYNLTTALRQSVLQPYTSWIFYLPLALFIPLPLFYLHKQFNSLYQFWIHTKLVGKLGPLEWVFNTPSHHRVHHARNPKYIDKNYAGVLIIWDRMFGTFEEESDEVVYGLVHPLNSFDPLWTQIHHYVHILNMLCSLPGFWNKVSVLLKGPGWSPGKPRLGDIKDIPEVDPADTKRKGPSLPFVLSVYVLIHFIVVITMLFVLLSLHNQLTTVLVALLAIFCVFSFTSFGAMFDNKIYAFHMEITRLVLFLGVEVFFWLLYKDEFVFLWYKDTTGTTFFGMHRPLKVVRALYLFSVLWLIARYAIFPFYGEVNTKQAAACSSENYVIDESSSSSKQGRLKVD